MQIQKLFFLLGLLIFNGLQAQTIQPKNITIRRDKWGVPHIFAKTDAEVAYGLAWAHAEDDFSSIEDNMALSRARLAEVKGVEGAKMDFFVQFLRARDLVNERYFTELSPEYRRMIEGYAAGLNAYARAHPEELKFENLFPINGKDIETAFVTTFSAMSGAATALQAVMENKPYRNLMSYGSNGFAISPRLSADGGTYLINDPHWLINGGLTFYEAQIFSEEGWTLNGGYYPGMPMPANAITDKLGWNLPFNFPDLVDVYEMEINPENDFQYRFDGRWLDFEVDDAVMKVKTPLGKIKVKRELLWCKYGPAMRTEHGVYALRINALQRIGAGEQLYRMGKAQNWNQFHAALKMQRMPIFNVVYADRDGHILNICNGLVPVRNPKYNWQEAVPGNTSETFWTEFYPLDSLPQVLDPRCGYVYNCNSSPFLCTRSDDNPNPNDFPKAAGYEMNMDNDRSMRFRELIDGKTTLSFNELKAIKYDLVFPETLSPLRKTLNYFQKLSPEQFPKIAEAVAVIQKVELNGRLDNTRTALLSLAALHLFEKYKVDKLWYLREGLDLPQNQLAEGVEFAQKYMYKHHGKLEVNLAEIQFLMRGDKIVPCPGLPQNINSAEVDILDNGLLRVNRNSSFLQMARFTKDGVELETIHTYGSCNREGYPHYDDQMEMHGAFQTKKMSLDPSVVKAAAVETYNPVAD